MADNEPVVATSTDEVTGGDAAVAGPCTIFQNPSAYTIKHPLQHTWVLWFDGVTRVTRQSEWRVDQVAAFSTIEDFWRLWHVLKPAIALPNGANYHLFKEGIEPKWEDPVNQRGGKWVASFTKSQRDQLEDQWLDMMLAMIGGELPSEDEVCGAVVSVRKSGNRISVWTRNADNGDACKQIGRAMKTAIGISESVKLGYSAHKDAVRQNRSFGVKIKYNV